MRGRGEQKSISMFGVFYIAHRLVCFHATRSRKQGLLPATETGSFTRAHQIRILLRLTLQRKTRTPRFWNSAICIYIQCRRPQRTKH
jgi:hypothetical protein